MPGANLTAVRDSIMQQLAQARTPQDSIPLMYHLLDLSAGNTKGEEISRKLIETAHSIQEYDVELDAIRLYSNTVLSNDSLLSLCLSKALRVPQSNNRSETITFIGINRTSLSIRTTSESEKAKALQELISTYKQGQTGNIYEEILQLYTLCLYLAHSTTGDLYTQYLEKLKILIDQLPQDGRKAIPTLYYTQLSIIYTRNNEYEKAIKATKETLKIIHRLETEYKKQGRIYRNYDVSYYNCYRRILSNYRALSTEEVEDYYQKIQEIAKRNSSAKKDFATSKRPQLYYMMATHQYAKAMPILKETYEQGKKTGLQMQYLQYMIEAAKALNNYNTLLQATLEYNTLLEEYNKVKAAEKYKELQILYDVNELRAQNSQLTMEQQQAKIEWSRTILRITFIAITILICLLTVALWLYYRSRRLARRLQHSKQKLQSEQQVLLQTQKDLVIARDQAESANRLKTLFIQNMSHEIRTPLNAIVGFSQVMAENSKGDLKDEMSTYAEMISSNSELLLTLVGDVLDIAKMESGEITLKQQLCSVNTVCNMAITSVKHRIRPEVKMYFKTDIKTDYTLFTDPTRLEQVLINFLNNAAKFTHKGEIVLSYEIDNTSQKIIFSMTDTGIGVPADKAEVIFDRFEKLDTFTQGTGLGLHICRLIARMLKGDVKLDTSYTQGARFLFIHPLR